MITVAGSTGHIKGLKGKTKVLAPVMFNLIFPISSLVKGYGATQFIGMGENLPKKLLNNGEGFVAVPICKNAIGKTIFHDFHSDIQCPITAIWADDDEIATKRNVQELLSLYPNANKK